MPDLVTLLSCYCLSWKGNFLFDSDQERRDALGQKHLLPSVWGYIASNSAQFVNTLYNREAASVALIPNCSLPRLQFWADYYLRWQQKAAVVTIPGLQMRQSKGR